jgi:uncharacterized Ntn-hydrolase superfamily protein
VLGAAAGLAAGWLISRPRAEATRVVGTPEPDTSWADRWGDRVDAAVDAATDGFRAVERRWRTEDPIELEPLVEALARVPGADQLRVSVLGEGLVEIEGTASDDAVEAARGALLDEAGVRVVLNRVWTPSSLEPATN